MFHRIETGRYIADEQWRSAGSIQRHGMLKTVVSKGKETYGTAGRGKAGPCSGRFFAHRNETTADHTTVMYNNLFIHKEYMHAALHTHTPRARARAYLLRIIFAVTRVRSYACNIFNVHVI